MIFLISAVIAALFAFLLRTTYSPITVAAVAFVVAMFVVSFIWTVYRGKNRLFSLGLHWLISISSNMGCLWLVYVLPLQIFIYVGLIGGLLSAPYWSFLEQARKSSYRASVTIGSGAFLAVCGAAIYFLFTQPEVVYRLVHNGWVLAIFIAVAVLVALVAVGLILQSGNMAYLALLIAAIAILPLGIGGINAGKEHTYLIRTAEDMAILSNAPCEETTLFLLKNDIDFAGKSTDWFGKNKNFLGTLDGGGYSLSNLSVELKCENFDAKGHMQEKMRGMGLVQSNSGTIKDLHIKNSTFVALEGEAFGIFAAYSNGSIQGCSVSNCQITLKTPQKNSGNLSFSVGVDYGSTQVGTIGHITQSTYEEEGYSVRNMEIKGK